MCARAGSERSPARLEPSERCQRGIEAPAPVGGGIGLRGEELLSSHVVARRTGSRRERVRRALLDTGGGAPQRNRWICERKSTHAAL